MACAGGLGPRARLGALGCRRKVGEAYPEPRLLSRLIAAGVPITFSSDAHAPAEVGWGYERTLAIARHCGAEEYVTFGKRRQFRHALPR